MNEHLNGWRLHQQNLALSNALEDAKYFARRDALARLRALLRGARRTPQRRAAEREPSAP